MLRCAVIGLGMIGQAWAIIFARAGYDVTLWDPDENRRNAVLSLLGRQLAHLYEREATLGKAGNVLERIRVSATLQDCVSQADYVQENGPEKLPVRQALFAELDAATPLTTILASSTSGMRPSTFTAELAGRARCLVAHPANPPHLLPLLELCPAPWTDPAIIARAHRILTDAGREVAQLYEETDGFILNRLQGALLAEAFRLVAGGVTSVTDVDRVMKNALGPRWAFMGPFETIDLNAPGGIADFCERYAPLYAQLQAQMVPMTWERELIDKVAAARREALPLAAIPSRQRWRDEALLALSTYLKGPPYTRPS